MSSVPFTQPLFLISDGGPLRRSGRLVTALTAVLTACSGRVYAIQLREQVDEQAPASDSEVAALVAELLPACTAHRASLLLSRRIDLASTTGAGGVHLGAGGPAISQARAVLGQGACIGYSAHSVDEAAAAAATGAGYVLLAPIFPPCSKDTLREPLGAAVLARACAVVTAPIFALGGITAARAAACRQAGAAGVAAIGSILGAREPGAAAQAILAAWDEAI